ncbi:hypothetical protein FGO68_gene16603 [Halteria grandinella]|uniref:TRP C-terminal domain-containing protein n=1 Tax=Halteria grandinella TaxID=5974 RepID=A0A8J8NES0_HALGN|nr:hypothetical protein FGO68_gene16603 [Halteria grandinella]
MLSLFLQLVMNLIQSMLNYLSFMMSTSMVSLSVPGVASTIQSMLLQFIYLDTLMTDLWMTDKVQETLSLDEVEDDTPINSFFDDSGFGSQILLLNLGSTLVFLIVLMAQFVAVPALKVVGHWSNRARKLEQNLSRKLMWNGTIRFLIQQFQPLVLSSLINITRKRDFASFGARLSFSLSLLILVIVHISFFLIANLIRTTKDFTNPTYLSKYGTLHEGFHSRTLAKNWSLITMLKWDLMCFILVLLRNYPSSQLQLLLSISLLSTCLQLTTAPQLDKLEQNISLFNELMTSTYLYVMLCLTDYNYESPLREVYGMVLLGSVMVTFMVNIAKVMYGIVMEVWVKIKRKQRAKVIKMRPEIERSKEDKQEERKSEEEGNFQDYEKSQESINEQDTAEQMQKEQNIDEVQQRNKIRKVVKIQQAEKPLNKVEAQNLIEQILLRAQKRKI